MTNPTYLKMIAASHPAATVWQEETTLTPREQTSMYGVPVSPSDSLNRIFGIGDWEDTPAPVYIRTERGGYPGSGARYVMSTTSDSSGWYGWNEPTIVSGFMPIEAYNGAAHKHTASSMTVLADGSLLYVSAKSATVSESGGSVYAFRREPGSSFTALPALDVPFTVSPLDAYPNGWSMNPALATDETGRTYLAIQRHTHNSDATFDYLDTQVMIYEAPRGSDWSGNPFKLRTLDALDDALRYKTSQGGPGSMALAVGGGQALVVMVTINGTVTQHAGATVDRLDYYASGLTATASSACSAVYVSGGFVVAFQEDGSNRIMAVRVGDATQPLGEVTAVPTGVQTAGRMVSLSVDDGGVIYCTGRSADGLWISKSSDGGLTWSDPEAISGFNSDQAGASVWWRDRLVCGMNMEENIGTRANSAVCIDLGGWDVLSMPPVLTTQNVDTNGLGHLAPSAVFVGFHDPDGTGNVQPSTTGSPTIVHDATLGLSITNGGGDSAQLTDNTTYYGTIRHAVTRSVVYVVSGTVNLWCGDGANKSIRIDQTASSISVYDEGASSLIGTASISGRVEVVAWLDFTGTAYVFYRSASAGEVVPKSWSLITGAVTGGVHISQINVSTSTSAVVYVWTSGQYSGEYDLAPEIPYGRPLSGAPTYTTNGVKVVAQRGPYAAGETWGIYPFSFYGADRALATATYPNRSQRFEASNANDGYIAWQIGSHAEPVPPVWLVWIESNAPTVEISFHDGTSWGAATTVRVPTTMGFDGGGHAMYGTEETDVLPSVFVQRDELTDGWISLDGTAYLITGNTSGSLHRTGTSGQQAIIRTSGDAGGAFSNVTGDVTTPTSLRIVVPGSAQTPFRMVKGFRIKLSGDTPPGGYYYLKALVGPAVALGLAHGRDTRRTFTPIVSDVNTPSGFRLRARLGPVRTTTELSWQAQIDVRQRRVKTLLASNPTSITDDDGNPIQVVGATLTDVRGAFSDWASSGAPVLYVPNWAISVGTAGGGFRSSSPYDIGVIDGNWTVEDAGFGEEGIDDVQRGGTLTLRSIG